MRDVYVNLIGGRETEVLCRRPSGFAEIGRDETVRGRGGRGPGRANANDLLRPSPGGAEVEK